MAFQLWFCQLGWGMGMRSGRQALRLVEGACAAVVALGLCYAVLLALFADRLALLMYFKRGAYTPLITVFAGACIGWLCLHGARSRKRPSAMPIIGIPCVVGLVAVMWWTTHGTVEVHQIKPSPPSGRFDQSPPPGNAPGTVQPPAAPTTMP